MRKCIFLYFFLKFTDFGSLKQYLCTGFESKIRQTAFFYLHILEFFRTFAPGFEKHRF